VSDRNVSLVVMLQVGMVLKVAAKHIEQKLCAMFRSGADTCIEVVTGIPRMLAHQGMPITLPVDIHCDQPLSIELSADFLAGPVISDGECPGKNTGSRRKPRAGRERTQCMDV